MAYKKLKYWFDQDLATLLADRIMEVEPSFAKSRFVEDVAEVVPELELKDRVEVMADLLYAAFDEDYLAGLAVLQGILGPENPNETGMFTEFYWLMPVAKYVEKYGLGHFGPSMAAIKEITKRNTGEYAVRPYLEFETEKALAVMTTWSTDANVHVRRLASEGVRPRLPWAAKLDVFVANPNWIFPILDNLKDDPSRFVQKSVANCVNDVLKDNPDVGKAWISDWHTERHGAARRWILKHALRNLVKAEDPWACEIISKA